MLRAPRALPRHACGKACWSDADVMLNIMRLPVQYDCVVGTAHVGQVCVPLCPNSEGTPPCIPCEDVRANCAWVGSQGIPLFCTPCAVKNASPGLMRMLL